jgi:hypothetical protein
MLNRRIVVNAFSAVISSPLSTKTAKVVDRINGVVVQRKKMLTTP